jgi:predicted transcriptional regulator
MIIKTMKPFCEIIVSDVMPALRAIITDELSKSYGLSQTQISKKLGITQPAISQYKSEMRGQKTKILLSNKKIMELIGQFSHEIATKDIGAAETHRKLCAICKKIREEGIICELHKEMLSDGSCGICLS